MLVFRGVKQKLAKTLSITILWWWSCRLKKGQLQIMIIVTIQVPIMTIMISMGEHRYHTICILCNYNVRYVEILRECIIFLIPTISNLKNQPLPARPPKRQDTPGFNCRPCAADRMLKALVFSTNSSTTQQFAGILALLRCYTLLGYYYRHLLNEISLLKI